MTLTSSPSRHLVKAPAVRHVALLRRGPAVVADLTDFTNHPTPSDGYVVNLIHQDFPSNAWHDAEAVAWCESKFRTTDIGFDSNGTHDRGLFQLNDGGTEQYLMAMIGQNPKNLNLAFNPVLNVRAAALLYRRDGWSQWSCETAI
ncbi:MAG TPA: transglycosylase SLT domain-containing protein [Acidimicrobiales bacterium]|nr:transglycosylase SLT domain-containing protein [Acidimicrobiales bacterium]